MTLSSLARKILHPRRRQPAGEMARVYLRRLAEWRQLTPEPPGGGRVGVLVTPWLRSAVPFYNLEIALEIARQGLSVTVFWDASDVFGNASERSEVEDIGQLLEHLPPHLTVVRVDDDTPSSEAVETGLAESIVRENAIWKMRGEERADDFIASRPEIRAAAEAHLGRVHHLLRRNAVDWLLVPGGIYGLSAAYLAIARKLGMGVSTYDSDPGMLMTAHDGAAAHHADMARVFAQLLAEFVDRPWELEGLVEGSRAELAKRQAGVSTLFQFQKVAATNVATSDCNILVPLNLRWDSASLSRQRLFPTVSEWLSQLIRWVERNPAARLCLRQHPCERFDEIRGSDDVRPLIEAAADSARRRITFVAADDPSNTYDLMRTARVVLPFTSTLGVEAIMLGIPVVTSTNCYYADMGFVWNARTVGEYFDLIGQALEGRLTVDDKAQRGAALTYGLTQNWAQIKTLFTPAPSDFPKWTALHPRELWSLQETADMMKALITRVPLSYLRYRRSSPVTGTQP